MSPFQKQFQGQISENSGQSTREQCSRGEETDPGPSVGQELETAAVNRECSMTPREHGVGELTYQLPPGAAAAPRAGCPVLL